MDSHRQHRTPSTVISRRGALRGGVVLAAGAAGTLGMAAPASAAVVRSNIGYGYNVPTRGRVETNGVYSHPRVSSYEYNNDFYVICAQWADTYGSVLKYMTAGSVTSSWFGCIGVKGGSGSSNHVTANAFDCSGVAHTNGLFVDCNYSHTSGAGITANRRYAGLAWSGRKHMPEVGIVGTEPKHYNHIHFGRYKNGTGSLLLTKTAWDAWLVQYSCKKFMGVPITLDGRWGDQTTTYYNQLMSRLGMSGRNPFGSVADLQALAHTLTAKGVAGQAV